MMDFVLVMLKLRVLLPGSELVTSSVSLFYVFGVCVSIYSHSKFSGCTKTRRRRVVRREEQRKRLWMKLTWKPAPGHWVFHIVHNSFCDSKPYCGVAPNASFIRFWRCWFDAGLQTCPWAAVHLIHSRSPYTSIDLISINSCFFCKCFYVLFLQSRLPEALGTWRNRLLWSLRSATMSIRGKELFSVIYIHIHMSLGEVKV